MCLKDTLEELRRLGVTTNESAVRWAIKSGKVNRPRLDGSLRFDFSQQNLDELIKHFGKPEPITCP